MLVRRDVCGASRPPTKLAAGGRGDLAESLDSEADSNQADLGKYGKIILFDLFVLAQFRWTMVDSMIFNRQIRFNDQKWPNKIEGFNVKSFWWTMVDSMSYHLDEIENDHWLPQVLTRSELPHHPRPAWQRDRVGCKPDDCTGWMFYMETKKKQTNMGTPIYRHKTNQTSRDICVPFQHFFPHGRTWPPAHHGNGGYYIRTTRNPVQYDSMMRVGHGGNIMAINRAHLVDIHSGNMGRPRSTWGWL